MNTPATILKLTASMRTEGSVSRELADLVVGELQTAHAGAKIISRDLVETPVPFVDAEWIGANFTPEDARSPAQKEVLGFSDSLVAELKAADVIVIGTPIYNFGIPAALKAWVDMIARARLTFKYTENGPVGLLSGKRAILAVASGGTHVGSDIDFATTYLRHVLGFVGIDDVKIVAADGLMADPKRLDTAKSQIEAVAKAA